MFTQDGYFIKLQAALFLPSALYVNVSTLNFREQFYYRYLKTYVVILENSFTIDI